MVKILSVLFLSLCLTLVKSQDATAEQNSKLNHDQIWGFGVLAGIVISSLGFIAAILLVIAKKWCNIACFEIIMKFLFSLSCGALIGDAVIHILAEAFANSEINKKIVSLIFIASIFLFLIFNQLLHSFGIAHAHWVGEKCEGDRENHGHHHHELSQNNHSHGVKKQQADEACNHKNKTEGIQSQQNLDKYLKKTENHNHHHHHHHEQKDQHNHHNHQQVKNSSQPLNLQSEKIASSQNLKEAVKKQEQKKQEKGCSYFGGKGSAGYINIFGSIIHNFFDGLAIGIAFATGNSHQIIPVVVAIIAHQIPRQLGDVAILLRSQFTQTQTVLCNGLVNFLSLIGVFVGLSVVNMSQVAKQYIMVFVAGNFIYIASDIWQHILKNKGQKAKFSNGLQFAGLVTGIGSMFLLTLLQH